MAQIDKDPDEAAGPGELHRLLQRGDCCNGFPLLLERQRARDQGFDLGADAEGALGNLEQRIQDVKRQLHIRVRASCQQDAGLRQVRVLQPEQRQTHYRSFVSICPPEGRFRVAPYMRRLRAE